MSSCWGLLSESLLVLSPSLESVACDDELCVVSATENKSCGDEDGAATECERLLAPPSISAGISGCVRPSPMLDVVWMLNLGKSSCRG